MKLAGFDIPEDELEITAIHSGGPGGQNVNKVATAIHLRFDVGASRLPEEYKQRLLSLRDHRISSSGVIVIKAQRYRSQESNRRDALQRLEGLLERASRSSAPRRPTRPTAASKRRRIEEKKARGKIKKMRGSGRVDE
ncbi:MAG: alternative ribosome rescue aminoacyl-tRNA hydrolase ArfB [Gammaproteobacteria bacterium]